MGNNPPGEKRRQSEELTKQALADVLRARFVERRFRQTVVAPSAGISRTHLQSLLRADKKVSLTVFLELSVALGFDDACQLLRCVLDRRDQLEHNDARRVSVGNVREEIDTYFRHLPALLQQQGKFALIKGKDVAGIFDSYRDALTAGYQRFKLTPFLVKQIAAVERVGILPRIPR
ncbi:hypothetical protein [Steroidobacter sp.]|uniref:hypothetical protein n=1 Tax=Steroidobacter sp. TaxID=1978227 RepID=UPI001A406ACC|nr:hypothetical protein [Steroidobacter sp.]MBL8268542.1 hypothetical protein [Steroidobacter sp.]